MARKKNSARSSNKQSNRGGNHQTPVEYPVPVQGPVREHVREPIPEPYQEPAHGSVHGPFQGPPPRPPSVPPEQMVDIDLGPPQPRVRETRKPPSQTQRNSHKAAIRHNLTLADRVYTNVQDVAYQAGFEIHNAYKHPHQIPGRLGNAVAGAASGATSMGAGLGYAVAAEAGEAGMMLVDSCGRLAQSAGNSAHRAARRAARRASNHIFGIQEQDGGLNGGYGDHFENIKHTEAEDDEYEKMVAWPEEEEKPMYKGYY
ncbi:hypothetical protein TWF281_001333 [Arthrobotrys megalospora]